MIRTAGLHSYVEYKQNINKKTHRWTTKWWLPGGEGRRENKDCKVCQIYDNGRRLESGCWAH